MKEFNAQTGGRYTYVDDVLNLQELALAFSSIFSECDNFIISGCNISGSTISPGYIYLNGKIRYFSGASGVTSWPRYIYESNKTESVAYASGSDKVGRNVYGCAINTSVPSTLDPLTGKVAQYIKLTATGGLRMKDALFGKYALLLNPAASSQRVNGVVNFQNNVNVEGVLTAKSHILIQNGDADGQIYYANGKLIIQSRVGSGTIYQFAIDPDGGFKFAADGRETCTVDKNGTMTVTQLNATKGQFASLCLESYHIYNRTTATNNGTVAINMLGYSGGSSYYRDTVIGNGKGAAIISVTGSTRSVFIQGTIRTSIAAKVALRLDGTTDKSDSSYLKTITFNDIAGDEMAYMGYNSGANNVFEIKNNISNVSIQGVSYVDLGPVIYEGGVKLSDRYALKTNMSTELGKKANSTDVYTKTVSDSKFAAKDSGFSQFIVGANTQAALRSQIGALGASDLNAYPKLDNLLSDMATTESKKQQICNNIGAARVGDFQPKLKDTGWVNISGTSLYARQIGNIVCIQGQVKTVHTNQTLFYLPNQIDAPRYDVSGNPQLDCNCDWGCKIPGGTKSCIVVYCNHCGKNVSLSMTYMV